MPTAAAHILANTYIALCLGVHRLYIAIPSSWPARQRGASG